MSLWSAPVRYGECDQQGIVFNAHYLAYADEAATTWFDRAGVPYADLLARGLDTRVKAAALEWVASARWGDTVVVRGGCEHVGGTSFRLALTLSAGDRPCCTVRTTYVLVDAAGRPARVPDDLRASFLGPGGA